MKVYAISDLHLSFAAPPLCGELSPASLYKPMDIFGSFWHDHYQKIYDNWIKDITPDDAVLMCGDTSWGMDIKDCLYDFDFLAQLPGKIYLSKGNHDYWWKGIGNVRQALPTNVIAVNHDSQEVAGKAVCATRGWILPGHKEWGNDDDKIYQRELLRLRMALDDGRKRDLPLVAMLHFMPFACSGEGSSFTELLSEYRVEKCIYGHLHGEDCHRAVEGVFFGTEFYNVSCDCRDFRPVLLWQTD